MYPFIEQFVVFPAARIERVASQKRLARDIFHGEAGGTNRANAKRQKMDSERTRLLGSIIRTQVQHDVRANDPILRLHVLSGLDTEVLEDHLLINMRWDGPNNPVLNDGLRFRETARDIEIPEHLIQGDIVEQEEWEDLGDLGISLSRSVFDLKPYAALLIAEQMRGQLRGGDRAAGQ